MITHTVWNYYKYFLKYIKILFYIFLKFIFDINIFFKIIKKKTTFNFNAKQHNLKDKN